MCEEKSKKKFKKVLKHINIGSSRYISFDQRLQSFLEENNNIKILHIVVNEPYHFTIIYEVKIPV